MYNDVKTVDTSNAKDTMHAKEANKQRRGRMLESHLMNFLIPPYEV